MSRERYNWLGEDELEFPGSPGTETALLEPEPVLTEPLFNADGSINVNGLFGFGRKAKAAPEGGAVPGGGANCGIGAGGFQPGNTCAKGGGAAEGAGTPAGRGLTKTKDELIRSKEFKDWFGDSKVVGRDGKPKETAELAGVKDEGGRPVPVYHGTPRGEFFEFKKDLIANPQDQHYGPGFYFTEDVKAAEVFSKGGHSGSATGQRPTVMEYFLKARKPFDVDTEKIDVRKLPAGEKANVRAALVQKVFAEEGRSEALEAGRNFDRDGAHLSYRELTDAAGVGGLGVSKSAVQRLLQEQGYDSIKVQAPDVGEKGKNVYWVVFEPTQVKSTKNKGTFDPNDPNVLNTFCPTGEGGGIDPTCPPGGKSGFKASVTAMLDSIPGAGWIRRRAAALTGRLVNRYGKTQTVAIVASGQAVAWGSMFGAASVGLPGVFVPAPLSMAPGLAMAEVSHQLKKRKKRRNQKEADAQKMAANARYPVLSVQDIERLGRELHDELTRDWNGYVAEQNLTDNVFCPTGPGGGVDPTCKPGGKAGPNTKVRTKHKLLKIAREKGTPCDEPCHDPDPTKDYDGDGVTDGARVGVGAMSVPPPPSIGRLPNLTPHERKVEQNFIRHYENNPDQVANDFRDIIKQITKPGDAPTFGTDDAKQLADAWKHPDQETRAQNRSTLNLALHQTANAIAKRAFLQELNDMKPGDEVLVTVGGVGAGKGYALKQLAKPEAPDSPIKTLKSRVKAVWDSAGDQNATESPWVQQEAEKRGLKVNYVFVHADPKVHWADPTRGVVSRAKDPSDGRMVDARVFADSYALGVKNHQAFYERNKDNPAAAFTFLDNTGKPKLLDGIPKEALGYDAEELVRFALEKVKESDAPPRVKRGATMGERVWKKAA